MQVGDRTVPLTPGITTSVLTSPRTENSPLQGHERTVRNDSATNWERLGASEERLRSNGRELNDAHMSQIDSTK